MKDGIHRYDKSNNVMTANEPFKVSNTTTSLQEFKVKDQLVKD